MSQASLPQSFDVIIIGAGLSGIGTACTLQKKCPNKSFAILERRASLGGTWDLFKYPGIRSDSDMHTLGYKFRPWTDPKVLADGASIKQYITDTAEEFGIEKHIHYNCNTTHASWNTADKLWTLTTVNDQTQATRSYQAKFVIFCSGYYNYNQGYTPDYPNQSDYQGQFIHPQHWPDNLEYANKKIVVIGSGATAVTLVPALAAAAEHVTMLQRSPTYIVSLPSVDKIALFLQRFLPLKWVHTLTRKRNITIQRYLYVVSQKFPNAMRKLFLSGVRKEMGADFALKDFNPKYNPWDQRLCAVPDGDLFKALTSPKATIVTDSIKTFTATGLELQSGQHLTADIVVSATGLNLELLGGMSYQVDGVTIPTKDLLCYKAVLIEKAPNLGIVFGYTNAPWTLKADLAAEYICRLLQHMDAKGYQTVTPNNDDPAMYTEQSVMGDITAGYVQRAADTLPRQGKTAPWQVFNHYKKDQKMLLKTAIEDHYLTFE